MKESTRPDVRWYGASSARYTPLGTSLLPRPGYQNEIAPIAHDILGVILQDGAVVQVNSDDYYMLRARGWIGRWTARPCTGDNTYPSVNHGDKIRYLARLILDARQGERVGYLNGNKLDLTRANLRLRGRGGHEIHSGGRQCPIAPLVGAAEARRIAAQVAIQVGGASTEDRQAVAALAVSRAQPSLCAVRLAIAGGAA